jgi:hypothetical protein
MQFGFLLDGDRRSAITAYYPMTGASMNLRGTDLGWGFFNVGMTVSGELRERFHWFADADAYTTGRLSSLQSQFGLTTRW